MLPELWETKYNWKDFELTAKTGLHVYDDVSVTLTYIPKQISITKIYKTKRMSYSCSFDDMQRELLDVLKSME